MFDFAWSEIALIGVVALVLIGPKDMPIALKYISGVVKKARRMATEFQGHVDEMVRDADLHEVRDHVREIRSLDIRGTITRAVDRDGSIRKAFTEDPVRTPPPVVTTHLEADAEHTIAAPAAAPAPNLAMDEQFAAPAFVPPPGAAGLDLHAPSTAPAFIPPAAAVPVAVAAPPAPV